MSTTDMAYDMTDSQTTQAHVRQIFASSCVEIRVMSTAAV